jgi:hypothetical protein
MVEIFGAEEPKVLTPVGDVQRALSLYYAAMLPSLVGRCRAGAPGNPKLERVLCPAAMQIQVERPRARIVAPTGRCRGLHTRA